MRAWPGALCLAGLLLSGCYEGWDPVSGGNGSSLPTIPSTPAVVKLYGYALFQPISMAADAEASTTCFPEVGIVQYKTTEWQDRISAITSALNSISDVVVVNPLSISASDCTVLSAVQASSLDPAPWSSSPSPTAQTTTKPLLHLKASFWEEEPSATPPATVTARDWVAWKQLETSGLTALSLTYFVISNPDNGYFTQWQAAEPSSSFLDGTPINTVDPTASGISQRTTTITSDTQALLTWLNTQGSKL